MGKLDKICHVCSKVFSSTRKSKKLCSIKCKEEGRMGYLMNNCINCGQIFRTRRKHQRHCSSRCWTNSDESKKIVSLTQSESHKKNPRNGERNGMWNGGSTPEFKMRLLRVSWKKIRNKVLESYKNTCNYCGSTENLHVHHKIPYREGGSNDISNLEVACNKCHMKVEIIGRYQRAINMYCFQCQSNNKEYDDGDCRKYYCSLYPFTPCGGKKTGE